MIKTAKLLALLLLLMSCVIAHGQEVLRLPSPVEPLRPEQEFVESPDAATAIELDLAAPDQSPARWYYPSYWFGPTPWDTGLELGINGSSGNSDALSTRVGGYVKRKTDSRKLDFSLYHNRTKTSGLETQNNALLNLRHDWLVKDSPWSVFLLNQTFYDEFQSFDLNINVNSGVGYQWVETDYWKLGSSLGVGASREFGARRDEWVGEGQAGVKWEQNLCDTQKFYAKLDYFPEFEDFNRYRLMTDIGWEVELSRPSNVSLKFSLADRFDSHPEGFNPHNTNYSVLLLWKK